MTTRATELSVVVVGAEHNPTILNPNFLEDQGIVSRDWGWDVGDDDPPLTTPVLSRVSYASGVLITVQRERLQVTDLLLQNDVQNSKAPEIAKRYVKVLPHVEYRATGINFTAVVEIDEPKLFLRERFLKEGSWFGSPDTLSGLGLRLKYLLANGEVTLSLDASSSEPEQQGRTVSRGAVIARANFHRECQPPSSSQVERNIDYLTQDWETFKIMVRDNLQGAL